MGEGRAKSLIIGGSNAYLFQEDAFGSLIEKRPIDTPFGESAPLALFEREGFRYYFLSRHGEKGYEISAPFVNYRANIFAARLLGVERIISWSGPGIIDMSFNPGSLMIPDDLLDFTKGRPSTFYEGKGIGFIRQNPVFCPDIERVLSRVAAGSEWEVVRGGTYACTEGPRLETPAEIRMLSSLGAQVVGMTVSPEAFLARELEICYHPVCYLTNYAEGVKEMPYEKGVLFEGTLEGGMKEKVDRTRRHLPGICLETLRKLDGLGRSCPCSVSMERYRRAGVIGDDFREWVGK